MPPIHPDTPQKDSAELTEEEKAFKAKQQADQKAMKEAAAKLAGGKKK